MAESADEQLKDVCSTPVSYFFLYLKTLLSSFNGLHLLICRLIHLNVYVFSFQLLKAVVCIPWTVEVQFCMGITKQVLKFHQRGVLEYPYHVIPSGSDTFLDTASVFPQFLSRVTWAYSTSTEILSQSCVMLLTQCHPCHFFRSEVQDLTSLHG